MTRSSTYDRSPIHTTLEHTSNITTPPEEQSLIRVQQVLSITHRLADRNVGGLRSMRFTMGRYAGAQSLENVDNIVQRITDATIIALNENLFSQILYQQTPGDWETAILTAPQQQEINVLDDNEENFPSLGSLGGQAKHKYKKTKRKTKRKTKNLKKKSKKQKLKTKNA